MNAAIAHKTATATATATPEPAPKCGNDTPFKLFVAGKLNQVNSI